MKIRLGIMAAIIGCGLIAAANIKAEDDPPMSAPQDTVTITGEVLDMACYLDHGAQGTKHTDCAQMCIGSGLPVGLKDKDGKVYLVIGEHKPLNKELAPFAAKTITIKGKLVTRDGINLLENAEIVK